MAYLKLIQGNTPGQILELNSGRMVLGRHPNCEIVLDNPAISRQHALLLESHGTYFLEDLRSRNRTFINDTTLQGRVELKDGDVLKVCDYVFSFHSSLPAAETDPLPPVVPAETPEPDQDSGAAITLTEPLTDDQLEAAEKFSEEFASEDSSRLTMGGTPELEDQSAGSHQIDVSNENSSIISTMGARSGELHLRVRPEATLRAVLDMTRDLSSVLKLNDVLGKALDGLLRVFAHADSGFVLLREPGRRKLVVSATRIRPSAAIRRRGGTPGSEEDVVRVSMTIVRKVLESCHAVLSADAVRDKRFQQSESLCDLRIRSVMCAPLLAKDGEILGVLQIDTRDPSRQFTEDDLDMFTAVAGTCGLAVENARLHETIVQKKAVERELEFATQVQLGFLPDTQPQVPGYEFDDYYEAAQSVGGDYFDYIRLPDDRIAIAVGDVAGKGVPAALLMARLYSAARYHLLTAPSLGRAMSGLNTEIHSSGLGHRFITCIFTLLDPAKHQVTIANAGHMPPLVRKPNGKVEAVTHADSGMPLGVVSDQEFSETKLKIPPGTSFTWYTDGITEAMNGNREIYGRERLSQCISRAESKPRSTVKAIVEDVEQFSRIQSQRDDMCLVCLRRLATGEVQHAGEKASSSDSSINRRRPTGRRK